MAEKLVSSLCVVVYSILFCKQSPVSRMSYSICTDLKDFVVDRFRITKQVMSDDELGLILAVSAIKFLQVAVDYSSNQLPSGLQLQKRIKNGLRNFWFLSCMSSAMNSENINS